MKIIISDCGIIYFMLGYRIILPAVLLIIFGFSGYQIKSKGEVLGIVVIPSLTPIPTSTPTPTLTPTPTNTPTPTITSTPTFTPTPTHTPTPMQRSDFEEYFDKYVPSDQYGFSKYLMNKYAQLNSNIYNLRVFSVFGKYEDWRYRFISKACCCAIMDLPIIINQNVVYDFLYIDDLVRLFETAVNKIGQARGEVFNVGGGS